jgi:opacity protein-like surface antigen
MKKLLITALIALALSSTAQAKAKPKPPFPPPPVAGSCKLDKGIWLGHCQTVPPIKIPTSPKPGKVEKVK